MEKKLGTKIAVAGVGIAAIAGLAIASPALAANKTPSAKSTDSSTSAPSFGMGDHGKGKGHGPMGDRMGSETSQTVTVNVPDDGGTYLLVVTEAAPTLPAGVTPPTDANGKALPAPKPHSKTIALTGTGAQTVTIPGLHSGKFTLQLVKAVGAAVDGEVGTDGKLVTPITVG